MTKHNLGVLLGAVGVLALVCGWLIIAAALVKFAWIYLFG